MLHDHHRVHAAAGGNLKRAGAQHFESAAGLLPDGLLRWLYRFGLERGFYDALLDRMVVQPTMRLSRLLGGL
jgi:NADH-quinone oxidoreductase subunit L